MFKRFTDSAKRVIFFALFYARLDEAPAIDSVCLLRGLMYEDTRANMLFRLRERFPMYGGCPGKFATYEAVPKPELGLDHGAKRILARAAWEADNLGDHWIDAEHLFLAILAVGNSAAAQYLAQAGLTYREAWLTVLDNKRSRPDYGRVPLLWRMWFPFDSVVLKLRAWRYRKRLG